MLIVKLSELNFLPVPAIKFYMKLYSLFNFEEVWTPKASLHLRPSDGQMSVLTALALCICFFIIATIIGEIKIYN